MGLWVSEQAAEEVFSTFTCLAWSNVLMFYFLLFRGRLESARCYSDTLKPTCPVWDLACLRLTKWDRWPVVGPQPISPVAQGSGQCTPDAVACLLLVGLNFWSPWKCHRRSLSTSTARTENTFLWHLVPCGPVTAPEKLSHLWSPWPTSLVMFGVQAKAQCVLWFPHFHVHS